MTTKKFEIYQVKRDLPKDLDIRFIDYEIASRVVGDFNRNLSKFYNKIYECYMDFENDNIYRILEDIYAVFNIDIPDDFTGHSLSKSDIVKIDDKLYYCDSVGWQVL